MNDYFLTLIHVDTLAGMTIALVGFIGLMVGLFSIRYMNGDSRYNAFFCELGCLIVALMLLAVADHLLLFLIASGISNVLLVKLMIHKPTWKPAVNAGKLAGKAFIISFICLTCAFALLYQCTGQTSIQAILHAFDKTNGLITVAMILILIGAMSQSAIWPHHRWLISSLNSPTPVSAIMHAGLVNGGGFLIIRFAPLFLSQPTILTVIFILGLGTALLGTLWKLMQHDIKRMLACSTMGQMGFMFVQCGLGLFPAAVAHLCWHSLFKANLFFSSNSTIHAKQPSSETTPSATTFVLACLCGIAGSRLFSWAAHHTWLANNSTLILTCVVFITATQLALKVLHNAPWKNLILSIAITGLACTLYGYSVYLFEYMLSPLNLMHPESLTIIHYSGIILMTTLWLMMLFSNHLIKHNTLPNALAMLYVKALNASQPDPSTITSIRNQYQYKRG